MYHRRNFTHLVVLVLSATLLLAAGLVSSQEEQIVRVDYYGQETTFQELDASGIVYHCATEATASLEERGYFDASLDTVLCFDTLKEAHSYFFSHHPEFAPAEETLAKPGAIVGVETTCGSNHFDIFGGSTYTYYMRDVCNNIPNYTTQTWSIKEIGAAAMTVYRATWYNSSSWTIGESHWTLSNGWGGSGSDGINSIDMHP